MNTKHLTPDEAEALLYDRIGDGFTFVAVAMTSWAGWHLGGDSILASVLIALLMGLVTYGLAHALKPLVRFWQAERYAAAVAVAIVAGLFFVGEYNGHLMFQVSHRKADIEQATLQDTRYDDTRSSVDELKFKKQTLEKQKAKLEDATLSGWNSTKPTAAWQADITNLEGDKLFKRSNGCSSVTRSDSRAFCDKLAEARANLAVAQSYDDTVAQLKATDTALLSMRDKSADTHKGESITADSTKLFAQISTGSLAPASSALAWTNIGVGGFISLLSTIGAAFFKWLAASYRSLAGVVSRVKEAVAEANPLQPQIDELRAMLLQMAQYHQPMSNAAVAPVSAPSTHTKELMVVKEDDPRAKRAYDALQQLADEARALKHAA